LDYVLRDEPAVAGGEASDEIGLGCRQKPLALGCGATLDFRLPVTARVLVRWWRRRHPGVNAVSIWTDVAPRLRDDDGCRVEVGNDKPSWRRAPVDNSRTRALVVPRLRASGDHCIRGQAEIA